MATDVDRLSVEELRDSRASWWSGEFDDFLSSVVAHVLPGRLLDVGCGIGTFERHFVPRSPFGTALVGADIDIRRLAAAVSEPPPVCSGASVSYVAGDGRSLPFGDKTFRVALAILTLQHVTDAVAVLREMRRVTEPGGVVVAVEADNLSQRLYFPFPAPDVDAALAAYWRRIEEGSRPANIAIGPRLPELFRIAGCASPGLKAHILANVSWTEPRAFAERARAMLQQIARKHGIDRAAECEALVTAIDRVGSCDHEAFYTISTVPLFLVSAPV